MGVKTEPSTEFKSRLEVEAQIVTRFPEDMREEMWKQGIDLDDWDYAVIVPVEALEERETQGELAPRDYNLCRLLTGCFDNTWYRFKWGEETIGIGIAYHA